MRVCERLFGGVGIDGAAVNRAVRRVSERDRRRRGGQPLDHPQPAARDPLRRGDLVGARLLRLGLFRGIHADQVMDPVPQPVHVHPGR